MCAIQPKRRTHQTGPLDEDYDPDEAEARMEKESLLIKEWGRAFLKKDEAAARARKNELEKLLGRKVQVGWLKDQCASLADDGLAEFNKFRDEQLERPFDMR